MKILILGGTNFIGYHVVQQLMDQNTHELMLFNRGNRKDDIPPDAAHIAGNRNQLADYRHEFARFNPDIVLDMMPLGEKDATLVMDVFLGMTDRIVAISSCDVYRAYDKLIGNQDGPPDATPLTEDSPLRETYYPYRKQPNLPEKLKEYDKILAERVFLGDPDLPGTILRLPMVYGPRDYQHRLFEYFKRMDDGRPHILLDENHAQWRSTRGYVEHIAHAVVLALTKPEAAGRVYNVSDLDLPTEADWIHEIGQTIGWDGSIIRVPAGKIPLDGFNPMHHLATDTTRIRQELGFAEYISRVEGLQKTIEWERANPPNFNPSLPPNFCQTLIIQLVTIF